METKTLHRLVGGLVLLGIGVVFLPMVFDGSGTQREIQKNVALPENPSKTSELNTAGIRAPLPSATQAAAVSQPPASPSPDTRVLAKAVESPQSVAKSLPETPKSPQLVRQKPTVEVVDAAARSAPAQKKAVQVLPPVSWTVQVGSFSSEKNANSLVGKLRKEGMSAFVRQKSAGSGIAHRVLVGPYAKQSEAAVVQKRVIKKFDIKGFVVMYQP